MNSDTTIARRTVLKSLGACAVATGAVGSAAANPRNFKQEVAEIRAATAEYNDPRNAYADGYVAAGHDGVIPLQDVTQQAHAVCGMGFHLGNRAKMGSTDPTDPPILVYGVDDGELVLGGVEFIVPKEGPHAEEPPDLFDYDWGGEFWTDGPGEDTWTLHAWVHTRNPAGTFAPLNPREQFHPEGCMGGDDH